MEGVCVRACDLMVTVLLTLSGYLPEGIEEIEDKEEKNG